MVFPLFMGSNRLDNSPRAKILVSDESATENTCFESHAHFYYVYVSTSEV